jgi:hypothetical protein
VVEVAVSKSTRIRSAFGMRVVEKKEKEKEKEKEKKKKKKKKKKKNAWRRRVG